MPRNILVDANLPREVCERLRVIGFDVVYLPDVLARDTDDREILEWMKLHRSSILTRDRKFPEDGGCPKIMLTNESPVRQTRQALRKLLDKNIFPEPLKESWEDSRRERND